MSKTTIPQVFEEVEKAKTREEKIRVLRKYNDSQEWPYGNMLRGFINLNFRANIQFQLPEGAPPYKADKEREIGYTESNLFQEYRRLNLWVNAQSDLPRFKRENLFVQMLEAIHWTEAEFIIAVKDRKLTHVYPSVTVDLIREALPQMLPESEPLAEIPPLPKPSTKKASAKKRTKKASGDGLEVSLSQEPQTL